MFRFILYAVIIYLIYLVLKWVISYSRKQGIRAGQKKSFRKSGINFDNIEEADFTEVKKDKAD